MNKLIVLSGIPGSGKSYFCSTLKKVRPAHTYIVSTDALRNEICGTQSDLTQDELMWKMFYKLAEAYSIDPEGVVVLDATFISPKVRIGRNREIKEKFDEIDLLMWDINRDVVCNQNIHREYPVPIDAMGVFFEKFKLPTPEDEEFFDKIVLIKDSNLFPAINALGLDTQDNTNK